MSLEKIMKKALLTVFLMYLIFLPAKAEETSVATPDEPKTEDFGMIYQPEDNVTETSQDDVFLNLNPKIPEKKLKKFSNKKYDLTTEQDKNISPQNVYKYADFNPYSTKTTSFTNQKQHGNFTLGTKYDSSFAPNAMTQTSTLFSKYQKNNFSFNTSYKSNSFSSLDQKGKGTLSFTPEYKLNSHASIQNIYSTSFLDKNKKSELVFSLKPFKDDRMNFDIGASQIYSETSAPTRSQLNFSTKFKF